MSAPAPSALRSTTRGFCQVPNSLVENQALLTDAELRLALVVIRRGSGVTVSDRNWHSWTGLSKRAKDYAVAGLTAKGLSFEGRGDTARYTFGRSLWERFVVEAPELRARTKGRKEGVAPKVGAKVHTECRERGCALMQAEKNSDSQLTLVASSPGAQPVACSAGGVSRVSPSPVSRLTPSVSVPVAQPVAQIETDPGVGVAEDLWAKTLAALRGLFPLVGVSFLVRLLAAVRVLFAGVTDDELSRAVLDAWKSKRNKQTSEGLFLYTVPEALARMRRETASPGRASGSGGMSSTAEGFRLVIARALRVLADRGAGRVPELEELAELEITEVENIEVLERIPDLESAVVEAAGLTDREVLAVEGRLAEERAYLARQLGSMTTDARARWDARRRVCASLEVIGVNTLDPSLA